MRNPKSALFKNPRKKPNPILECKESATQSGSKSAGFILWQILNSIILIFLLSSLSLPVGMLSITLISQALKLKMHIVWKVKGAIKESEKCSWKLGS